MLAGAGLRDDPSLAEALGDQRLPDGVVDLVRTRVREVLALEIDARTADVGGQALGQVDRRGAADVVAREAVALGREGRIGEGLADRDLELVDGPPALEGVPSAA